MKLPPLRFGVLYLAGAILICVSLGGGIHDIRKALGGTIESPLNSLVIWTGLAAAGALSIAAAAKRYYVGSPTVVGLAFILTPLAHLSTSIDKRTGVKPEDFLATFAFLVIGGLLIRSGHRLHQYRKKEASESLTT
jgi:hypothetical protein